MALDTLKAGDLKVEAMYVGGTEGTSDFLSERAALQYAYRIYMHLYLESCQSPS